MYIRINISNNKYYLHISGALEELKMAKEQFLRNKLNINVGNIGHVDHGKTTLTAAITTVLSQLYVARARASDQTDNALAEKARRLTIHH